MIAENLISEVVPSLRWSDTGQKALNWMDIFRISHLPIVEDRHFYGLVSDKMIYDLDMTGRELSELSDKLIVQQVFVNQHIYQLVSLISEHKLSVVPVLDLHKNYQGVVTALDLAREFAVLVGVNQPGGVIELELNPIDYSLVQITQIVEGNDAKILSMYVRERIESKLMTITLKINVIDLSRIIQTFVRYDYNIKAVYMEESQLGDMYDDRFDQLMNYLKM